MNNIFKTTRRLFAYYRADVAAGIAAAFVVALPVLVGTLGMTLDLGQSYLVRQRLARALDAAALAGAASSTDEDVIRDRIEEFFARNYPNNEIGVPRDLDIDVTLDTVTVTAYADYETSFMRVLGFNHLTVSAESEVTRVVGNNIELALVLDISGSMNNSGKIGDLRTAAKSLIDIVVYDNQDDYYSKIAIVPYAVAVNVGSYAQQVRGPYTPNQTCNSPGCARYRFRNPYGNWRTHDISTCVSERTGAQAYTDAPPSTALVGRNYPPVGNPCLQNQIVPLTSDKEYLKDQIDALQATGSTGGQVGVAWGWYMLSPNWGYLWPAESRPAAYGTEELYKIMVLMTDGEYNSPYCNGVIARDATAGSGSAADHINCYAHNGGSYAQSERLCDAMKDAGVEIYTIGFQTADYPDGEDLMEYCATDAQHFFTADDGAELTAVFNSIANAVKGLHLSK